jgi:hypothetical protein
MMESTDAQVLQLKFEHALELIHLSHQAGLLTYMSAGFKFGGHIPQAVFAGTDGIGIGGAQILRYMDHQTGHQGPCKSSCNTSKASADSQTPRNSLTESTRSETRLPTLSEVEVFISSPDLTWVPVELTAVDIC